MFRPRLFISLGTLCLAAFLSLALPPAVASAENEGQANLDKATELKLTSEGIRDLNKVIELLEISLEEGLDAENAEFAESMLTASLLQRATALSAAVLKRRNVDPRKDPRWLQVRQLAMNDLQRVIELDDSQYEAHMLIGRLHTLQMGDRNAARRALTKVVEAEDVPPRQLAEAVALRGATQRDKKKQLEDFSRAIELDAEKPDYLLMRAKYYQRENEFDKAMADVDAALALVPENGELHEQKAILLLANNKLEEAMKSLDRASELAPDSISPYQYRGEALSRLGDLEKAIEQLNKAVELEPENLASRLIRSQLYLQAEKPEQAIVDAEAVLAKQPGVLRAHMLRVRALEILGRKDEAIATLEKLSKLAPKQPEVQLQLAAYYMDAKRPAAAIEALNNVLEVVPENRVALRLRGDMYLSIGKHNEALADFTKAYELDPDDAGLLNNLAWTLATSPFDGIRDGKRAIVVATKACELTEYEKPHILSTLAAAYAEAGDFDKAIEWAEKAVELESQATTDPEPLATGDPIEIDDQLAQELASYKNKKPWRERQELTSEEPEPPAAVAPVDPVTEEAPARSFDF